MPKTYLGEFEELVLLMIAKNNDQAYGLMICEEIRKSTGRNTTIGAVHATAMRLEKKGFIESFVGGESANRGGRRKRFLKITNLGSQTLKKSRDLKLELWETIPELNLSKS